MSRYTVRVSTVPKSIFDDSFSYDEKLDSLEDAKVVCLDSLYDNPANALIEDNETGDIIHPSVKVKDTGEYINYIPIDNSDDVIITWEKVS